METNLDDASSELVGIDFQNGLTAQGGIDFYFTSVMMKKGRPGLKLSVLVSSTDLDRVSAYILEHSSSIGLRYYPVSRTILQREQFEMDTPYGPVTVKQVTTPSGAKRNKIEYESLRKLQMLHKISILRLQEELYPLLAKSRHHEEE